MIKICVPDEEVIKYVDRRIKIFQDEITVTDYKKPIRKVKDGFESAKSEKGSNKFNKHINSMNNKEKMVQSNNIYRSKKLLIEYALMNKIFWTSFITLTFAENLENVEIANQKFNNFTSMMKRVFPDFKYLGVIEFQKRGAVHYHLLTNLIVGSELCPLQKGEKNKYDVKFWNYGYSSAKDLRKTDDNFNVALYITKYLTKDLDKRLFGRKKILKSNNLLKPIEIELSKNEPLYNSALDYLNIHDYSITEKDITPTNKYAIPMNIKSCKNISENDVEVIKQIYEKESEVDIDESNMD